MLQMKKSQDDRTQMNDNIFELLLAVVSLDISHSFCHAQYIEKLF